MLFSMAYFKMRIVLLLHGKNRYSLQSYRYKLQVCGNVTFLMYTVRLIFRSQNWKESSKRKPHRRLGTSSKPRDN